MTGNGSSNTNEKEPAHLGGEPGSSLSRLAAQSCMKNCISLVPQLSVGRAQTLKRFSTRSIFLQHQGTGRPSQSSVEMNAFSTLDFASVWPVGAPLSCSRGNGGFEKAMKASEDAALLGGNPTGRFANSPPWCTVVNAMNPSRKKKASKRNNKVQNPSWVRASISFPLDVYDALAKIAKQKKVSLAWVVREASEKYVAEQAAASSKQPAE
jgi:hypothetical protein